MLLTRSPLEHPPEEGVSLDLHVLSTPPAFVLSQDQTLRECFVWLAGPSTTDRCAYGVIAGLDKLCARRVPKESATGSRNGRLTGPQNPRTGFVGTDFRHAVEFSKSGRTETQPFRASSLAGCPTLRRFPGPPQEHPARRTSRSARRMENHTRVRRPSAGGSHGPLRRLAVTRRTAEGRGS